MLALLVDTDPSLSISLGCLSVVLAIAALGIPIKVKLENIAEQLKRLADHADRGGKGNEDD